MALVAVLLAIGGEPIDFGEFGSPFSSDFLPSFVGKGRGETFQRNLCDSGGGAV